MAPVEDVSASDMLFPLVDIAKYLKFDEAALHKLVTTKFAHLVQHVRGEEIHLRWGDLGPICIETRLAMKQASHVRAKAKMKDRYSRQVASQEAELKDGPRYLQVSTLAKMLGLKPGVFRGMVKPRLDIRDELDRDVLWAIICDGMAVYRGERKLAATTNRYIPQAIKDAVIARDQGYCRYCATKLMKWKWTFDHVIPFVLGGAHTVENLVQACRACNHRKFNHMLDEIDMVLLPPGTTRKGRKQAARAA